VEINETSKTALATSLLTGSYDGSVDIISASFAMKF